MSTPARTLARQSLLAPAPAPRPQPSADPTRVPDPESGIARRTGTRKRHHLGFALFSSTLVGAMVFAIVVLHVLLAQQSFRLDTAERELGDLHQENLSLIREQATLSAPGRIAEWATRHGMRLPDDIRILRAPNGPSGPAGAGTSSTVSQTASQGSG